MEELFVMLGFLLVILLFIAVVGYIVSAITYMTLAKKAGLSSPWIAWLPYGYAFIGVGLAKLEWFYALVPIGLSIINVYNTNLFISILVLIGILSWVIFIDRKILEAFGQNPDLAFIHLVPLVGSLIVFVIIMTIAFGDAQYNKNDYSS